MIPLHDGGGSEAEWVDHDVAVERLWLDHGSWVDVARGWLRRPDEVLTELRDSLTWSQGRVWRYERWMDEPRLGAVFAAHQANRRAGTASFCRASLHRASRQEQ